MGDSEKSIKNNGKYYLSNMMIMKFLMYAIVVAILIGCSSEEEKNNEVVFRIDSIPKFGTITVEWELPSRIFIKLLDSANGCKAGDPIPSFFYNHLLDYEYPWLADHRTLSLRKLIIDSTNNVALLKRIGMDDDLRLRKIADSIEVSDVYLLNALPYRDVSNYKLVQMRLERL